MGVLARSRAAAPERAAAYGARDSSLRTCLPALCGSESEMGGALPDERASIACRESHIVRGTD
ncbi:hypothetical protein ACFWBX_03330 [Streptomyces sp. NPDC059991]|uniref:hypothetical protein n=1 Tax=Streptomyces sp. NPDC059991 TaxID=3347028 RepID=UPI003684F5AF